MTSSDHTQWARWLDWFPEPAFLTDGEGRVVGWSAGAAGTLGATPAGVAGRPLAEVLHPAEPAAPPPPIEQVLAGDFWQGTLSHRTSAGHVVRLAWNLLPLPAAGGVMALGRPPAEEGGEGGSVDGGTRFAELVALLPQGVFEAELNGRLVFANEAAFRMFGYDQADFARGVTILETLAPADRARAAENIQLNLTGGRSGPSEYLARRADGREFPVIIHAAPIVRDGRACGFRGVVIDITERRRMEEALREREARFSALLQNAGELVMVVGPDRRVQYASDPAKRMLGCPPAELVGRSLLELVHPEDQPAAQALLAPHAPGEEGAEREIRLWRGGEEWLEASAVAAPLGAVSGLSGTVLTIRDITARRAQQRTMDRLQAQLLQAQKMESVGRLAGGMAHDFNNLLTGIIGNTSLTLMRLSPGDPLRPMLEDIGRAVQSAAALTRKLLAFSRKQVIELRPVDLSGLVTGLERMLARLLGEDLSLTVATGRPGVTVRGDTGQLEQVLVNLAVNARDAMPDGGHLFLEVRADVPDPDTRTRLGLSDDREWARVTVRDTGCGMSGEVRAHLFEPFFTTKPVGQGTGLGLATVYGIVHQHGGAIDVETAEGRGTTFIIYLPLLAGGVGDGPDPESGAGMSGGEETVLLVEDDELVRQLAARVLKRCGYRVLACANGPHALREAARHDGPIHLLLTDVVMPAMDGRQLADRLLVERPGMRVLYTSGYAEDVIVHRGVLEAGLHFMPKPFTPHELTRMVRRVLDEAGG